MRCDFHTAIMKELDRIEAKIDTLQHKCEELGEDFEELFERAEMLNAGESDGH